MSNLPKKIQKSKVPLAVKRKTYAFIDPSSVNKGNKTDIIYLKLTHSPQRDTRVKTPLKRLFSYDRYKVNGQYESLYYALPKKPGLYDLAPLAHQVNCNKDCETVLCVVPEGASTLSKETLKELYIGYALADYQFDHYKTDKNQNSIPKLMWPSTFTEEDKTEVTSIVEGITLIRDLINTPANDLTPHELMRQTVSLADEFNAVSTIYHHQATVKKEFPLIHAVGKASENKPGLAEFTWGDENHPKVTLVGKGITFDSGGLNIKTGGSMRTMKGDMGGAANVLGLARMIMGMNLPVRLHVVIPTAENSVAGNATRPSDIITSRKGQTVQIDNTDAEGRLILADALALACESDPDLLIDMATLTGSATAAYTPEVQALFTANTKLGRELEDISYDETGDRVQHTRYDENLERAIKSTGDADLDHIVPGSYGGMIIAAEFLKQFVHKPEKYIHLDIHANNYKIEAGHPKGGTDRGIRTLLHYLKKTYKP